MSAMENTGPSASELLSTTLPPAFAMVSVTVATMPLASAPVTCGRLFTQLWAR